MTIGINPKYIRSGERSVVSRISTLARDRDKEALLPEGIDLSGYGANSIVLFCHDYWTLDAVMGRSAWVKLDRKNSPTAVLAKTIYASEKANPKAEQALQLQKENIMLAKSVGFQLFRQ